MPQRFNKSAAVSTLQVKRNGSAFFQPAQSGLVVNRTNDAAEQEADTVANHVMQMPTSENSFFRSQSNELQRKCSFGQEEKLQMKGEKSSAGGSTAPAPVSKALHSTCESLDGGTRSLMESRFGYDFSNVQVHNDSLAHQSSEDINALAYTHGDHIVFGKGQYEPSTNTGKKLIAHELTHVIQQAHPGAPRSIQKKAVDDKQHLTCRDSQPTVFADMQGWEQQAIALCRGAAAGLRNFKPSMTGNAEDGNTHTMRDLLWRRFHLNYSRLARCAAMPKFADMYETVANNIAGVPYTWHCAAPGNDPSGDCAAQPGVAYAWTGQTIPKTQLCKEFWTVLDPEKVQIIIHELFHYSHGMGDCPSATNDDNPECFALFAAEFGGATTAADTHGGCCAPPKDPLPPPDIDAFNSTGCPGKLTVGLPEVTTGYSYGSGGHGKFLSAGLDLRYPFNPTSDWDITLGPRAEILDSLDKDGRNSYLLGVRAGAQLRSRPWRSGFIVGGFLEAGGVLNAPGKTGELGTGNYIQTGIKIGGAIRLPKDKALTIFTEFSGGQVNTNDNTLRYFTAGAGISIDL